MCVCVRWVRSRGRGGHTSPGTPGRRAAKRRYKPRLEIRFGGSPVSVVEDPPVRSGDVEAVAEANAGDAPAPSVDDADFDIDSNTPNIESFMSVSEQGISRLSLGKMSTPVTARRSKRRRLSVFREAVLTEETDS